MTDLLDASVTPFLADLSRHATTTSVLVVEDDVLVGRVVSRALRAAGLEAEVCAAGDGPMILDEVRRLAPQVVLLDLLHSGCKAGAPSLVASLRALGAQVVAFTDATDQLLLGEVVEAGVADTVSRGAPVHELVNTVRGALSGETGLSVSYRVAILQRLERDRAERRARLAPFASLTRREAAILGHLMDGDSAQAIAAACYVSLGTVRNQIGAVLSKLGVRSQLAAVAMAYRAGWSISDTAGR